MLTKNALRAIGLLFTGYLPTNQTSSVTGKAQNYTPVVWTNGQEVIPTDIQAYSLGLASFFYLESSQRCKTFPYTRNEFLPTTPNETGQLHQTNDCMKLLLYCGSGNTPATINDYNLENVIDFTMQAVTVSIVDTGVINITSQFINNKGTAQTIKEIGIFRPIKYYSDTYANKENSIIMLARKVLETPIVVEAGESFSMSYTLDFANMTD